MSGAAILYNLFLAELDPPREEVIESCSDLLKDWVEVMADEAPGTSRLGP